jgi:hypothetical protein
MVYLGLEKRLRNKVYLFDLLGKYIFELVFNCFPDQKI